MSLGTILILLLVVVGFLAMMRMHRGSGRSGHGGGHGCGGHSHGDDAQRGHTPDEREAKDAEKPVLGKPGPQHHEHEHVTGGTRPA